MGTRPFVFKPTVMEFVKFVFHHGGRFEREPIIRYVGDKIYEFPGIDVDEISVIEIGKIVKDIGYLTYKNVWYMVPGSSLDNGLRPLQTNAHIHELINDVKGFSELELYVEHCVDTPTIVSEDEDNEIGMNEDVNKRGDEEGDGEEYDVEAGSEEYDVEAGGEGEGEDVEDGGEDVLKDGDSGGEDILEDVDSSGEDVLEDVEVGVDIQGSDISDYEEGMGWLPKTSRVHINMEESNEESDDISIRNRSDDEGRSMKNFSKFKMPSDPSMVKFELGMQFSSLTEAKEAIKEYAIAQSKDLKFVKNDSKRLVVRCREVCPWYFRVSKAGLKFQVKTLKDEHTCPRQFTNRQVKTKFITKKLMDKLRDDPSYKTKTIVAEAATNWNLKLSRSQAYRSKRKAIDMLEGSMGNQYRQLWNYAEELRRSNIGSSVCIQVNRIGGLPPTFQRLYICFEACKKGFVKTCRPLIGLYGCFLKSVHGGQLLSAVGKDGNNQMFPIAFAIVEAETRDSWTWFLDRLLEDIGTDKRWAFISNQQKGLIPTLENMFGGLEHRVCAKHLCANFLKKFRGTEYNNAFWKAARSTTVVEWEECMAELKSLNQDAWEHLIHHMNGPKLWPQTSLEPIQPPTLRRAPRRPKKQRRKDKDEHKDPHKLRRQNTTVKCRRCGLLGHNIRTCKAKDQAERLIPKGGNKNLPRRQGVDQNTCEGVSESDRSISQSRVTTEGSRTRFTNIIASQKSQVGRSNQGGNGV